MIVSKPADLTKPAFNSVSDNAKNFIKCCLVKEIDKRYSAAQLLKHPWLVNLSDKIDKVSTTEDKQEVLKNLKEFANATKFQKTIISVLLGLRYDKEDLVKLRIAFNNMDKDGDGSLSMAEIMAAEKELGQLTHQIKWKEVLRQCDLDGDGKIDFQEFFTAAMDKQKVVTKQNLQYAFDTFDTNGDGTIDIAEFKSALPSTRGGLITPENQSRTRSTEMEYEDEEKWKEIIESVDKDGDGQVSFEEFCSAIESFIQETYVV